MSYAQELSKAEKRYEIDVKRLEVSPTDREALFRSREFIRLDPTYYVGYMYEGLFKHERASDYIGFRNAIPVLKKAMQLLEKDFSAELRKQYTDVSDYMPLQQVRVDYMLLTSALFDCYSDLEQPDSVMILLNHYKKWNFQRDMLGANNNIGWTYHRNRFYTSSKYSFLGNSIEENEKTALRYLHQGLADIEKNRDLNERVFRSVKGDELSVYHYLSLVHSYLRDTDSAYYYFRQMDGYNVFPHNNFAIFCFVNGEFFDAESHFQYAQTTEYGDKRIRESDVYLGILDVFRAKPEEAIRTLKEQIQDMGVVPGWGWDNLALARSYLYNGQVDKCMEHLNKARNFKELHIGSTWTQSHYDISIATLELMCKEWQRAALKFENKGYWYSPATLARLAQCSVEKDAQQLLLINRIAANPERNDVFYRIFASENTVTFDEVWFMLKDYGQRFFLKYFTEQAKNDERARIQKYFKLFAAKLMVERGNESKAADILDEINRREPLDPEFEKLFEARIYEAQYRCSSKQDDLLRFYETFPQLVPFSGFTMSFRLDVYDDNSAIKNDVLKTMKRYNVEWTKNEDSDAPRAIIYFSNDGKNDVITYSVRQANGRTLVPEQRIICTTAEDATKQLVYGLFKIAEPEVFSERR